MPRLDYTSGGSTFAQSSNEPGVLICTQVDMPANGWVTGVGMYMAKGSAGQRPARHVVYKGNTLAYESANITIPSTSYTLVEATLPSAVGILAGANVRFGMWSAYDGAFNSNIYSSVQQISDRPSTVRYVLREKTTGAPTAAPAGFTDYASVDNFTTYAVRGYLDYTANATPTKGTWKTPAASGTGQPTTVTLEGYMPHPAADSAYDSSASFDLQVYVLATGVMAINQNYATTQDERDDGYFSRAFALTNGVEYGAKFRHFDQLGVTSAWSDEVTFTVATAPNPPESLTPSGKVDVMSGFNYTGLYTHQVGTTANAAQVRVYNAAGTTLLYDSGTVAVSVASGGTITVPEFHADLTPGTTYRFEMRARDTANIWGNYSELQTFNANAAPNVPTNLAPADEQYTPTLTLTASVSDPDGDAITAAQAQLLTDANVATAGSPYTGVISGTAPNQVATFTIPSGDVTYGTRYKWRVRATDGLSPGYGSYSDYEFYRYQNVPVVSATVDDPTLVHNPSYTANYSHLSSLARTHAKWVLQKWTNGAWTEIYNTGWVVNAGAAPSTFPVTFPANTFRNHNDYRLKILARDTGGAEGETSWQEFTTDYTGPPALTVNVAQGIPEEATIELAWTASTLTPLEFAGIEVVKSTPGGEEDTQTVALILDPAATGYTYHFPVSNRTYTLSVRQIENVGVEQVDSDFTDSTVSVDYSPYHFVKDAADPTLFVAYETRAERLPAPSYEGLDAEFLTWQGNIVHLAGLRDYEAAEVFMEFFDESAIEEAAETRYNTAIEILSRRRTICILTQVPEAAKTFAVRKGAYQKVWTPPRTRGVSFSYREARYDEDYYERNGAEVLYAP